MKKAVVFCAIIMILVTAVFPVTVHAEEESNEFWRWLISGSDFNSMQIAKTAKVGSQLLSVRLVRDALSKEELNYIKNMTPDDVKAVKNRIENVVDTVSFYASDEAVQHFKSASKNAKFVDVGFADHYKSAFTIGFAFTVDDSFLVEGRKYYAYRYDSETKKLVSLGEATILFEDHRPYIGFETDVVSDFFITDGAVDVDYVHNDTPVTTTRDTAVLG